MTVGGGGAMTVSIVDAGMAYEDLHKYYGVFRQNVERNYGLKLPENSSYFAQVARSFIRDIHKYMDQHGLTSADETRVAAYVTKWVMKYRPVHHGLTVEELRAHTLTDRRDILMINETFCVFLSSCILQVDIVAKITAKLMSIVLYTLRFGPPSEDTVILFYSHLDGI